MRQPTNWTIYIHISAGLNFTDRNISSSNQRAASQRKSYRNWQKNLFFFLIDNYTRTQKVFERSLPPLCSYKEKVSLGLEPIGLKNTFFSFFFSISYKQSYVQSRHQTETYLNVGMVRSDELIIRPCSEVPIKWS